MVVEQDNVEMILVAFEDSSIGDGRSGSPNISALKY